ncbi:MAG: glutamate 5-kinase [Candidatus Melainabacteria bacterium]|jgi:glutamate 5-kinase|nr:glutamate 5-kinase [Candidatus Melainabacteria bacterium]
MDRKEVLAGAKRIVIKLGTAVLMKEQGGIALSRFYSFIEGIAALMKDGKEVLLVTSGAVGLGVQKLQLDKKPKLLPMKQACAAVGQGRLMALYSDAFQALDIVTAQILLTEEDFSNRTRYLNLRSTIGELMRLRVLPIINENDTVSTAEIESGKDHEFLKVNFGDNDKLSALVASKVDADLLVILTDVDGLFTDDPRKGESAKLIPLVPSITPDIEKLASGPAAPGKMGRGGMKTKLEAAKTATQSGCAVIIAGGKVPDVIPKLFGNEEIGTLFLSQPGLTGKKRWIAFATTVKAALVVNDGAKTALKNGKASLLPAGIVEVRGQFERGDVVGIVDGGGHEFARGIANYSSDETRQISGQHSDAIDAKIEVRNYDAIVTRDNIALLETA